LLRLQDQREVFLFLRDRPPQADPLAKTYLNPERTLPVKLKFKHITKDSLIQLHPVTVLECDASDKTFRVQLSGQATLSTMWVGLDDIQTVINRPKTQEEINEELHKELALVKDQLHDARYQIEVLQEKLSDARPAN
jgi:hypothetical protein